MRKLALAFALLMAAIPWQTGAQSPASLAPPAPRAAESAPVSPAPPRPGGGAVLTQADVEAWLDGFMPFAIARSDVAGAVVVVVKDGQVLSRKGYGFADVARRRPVDPDRTLFRVGSVSKLFTWTAVMQLVERGHLDLDRDVNAYLDFRIPPLDGKPVTLRQIMTHTAGFGETIRYLIGTDPKTLMPLGDFLKSSLPARVYAPGTTPAYSNYATALAGYIVQRRSGLSFDDYVERNVLRPIGMNGSSFRQPLPAAMRANMSSGYALASGESKPFEIIYPAPAGSLSASGGDMARFMLAHLDGGRGLLRPETARMMHDTTLTILPPLNRMALGFYEQQLNGRRSIAHGGDTELFHSDLWLIPSERVGVFVSLNSGGAPGAARAIRAALFEQFGDRYYPMERSLAGIDAAAARKHAAMMAGTYSNSRGAPTTFVRVLELFGQARLGVNAEGGLDAGAVTGLADQPRRWIEIAPFVWRDVASGERIAARVENGEVTRWSFDTVSPFMVFDRVPWYLDSAWLKPAAGAAVLILLLTALAWPARAFARRRYRAQLALSGRDRTAYRLTHGFAWLTLLALGGWAAFLMLGLSNLPLLSGALDPLLWTLRIVSPVAFIGLVVVTAWALWRMWTARRRWWSRLWSVLLLLAALIVLWVAVAFNLIGWGTAY